MKSKIVTHCNTLTMTLFLMLTGIGYAGAQTTRDIIMSAMRDEMDRNVQRLRIDDMAPPFFIGYNIYDAETMEITATLGSIVTSDENRTRNSNVRVMVGDYKLNDENFRGSTGSYRSSLLQGAHQLPLEDDYQGIRRALWLVTDDTYKSAAELFEHKKTALEQQTLTGDETNLDDFSRAPAIQAIVPANKYPFQRDKWEARSKKLSARFAAFPDIYSSIVRVFFYQADMYVINSEGTEIVQPVSAVSLQINAYTQAVDGEPLSDNISFYGISPDDLPDEDALLVEVETMAGQLMALRTAPVFDESYFGPVMVEGQAVARMFEQRLFSGKNGLLAFRRPLMDNTGGGSFGNSNATTLEDRIGRRILSRDLTVKALPSLKRLQGVNLLGSFRYDAEGVAPPEEITLVENGILKTLLNNRIPTLKVPQSNGHQRPSVGYWTSSTLAPGVISVSSSDGKSHAELKKTLINIARDEGLEYGILIRKLKPTETGAPYYDPMVRMSLSYGGYNGSSLSKPLQVYRVYVEDGREEAVRSVKLGDIGLSTLRHIVGTAKKQAVHNMLATANYSSGIPATFIVPESLILEEIEVMNENRNYTPKLPVVAHPLSQK